MNLLTALGLASMALVCWFTWHAYKDNSTVRGEQTRREAIVEVWIGIVLGFGLNWCLNWLLLPLVGAKFTGMENVWLGWCYTSVSVARSYFVRRWAERHIRAFSVWLAATLSTP